MGECSITSNTVVVDSRDDVFIGHLVGCSRESKGRYSAGSVVVLDNGVPSESLYLESMEITTMVREKF